MLAFYFCNALSIAVCIRCNCDWMAVPIERLSGLMLILPFAFLETPKVIWINSRLWSSVAFNADGVWHTVLFGWSFGSPFGCKLVAGSYDVKMKRRLGRRWGRIIKMDRAGRRVIKTTQVESILAVADQGFSQTYVYVIWKCGIWTCLICISDNE